MAPAGRRPDGAAEALLKPAAAAPETAQAPRGTRYALLKHPARLKPGEARRLERLRRANRALDRAYELKEYLATILGQAPPEEAAALLDEWLEWAARSRLAPFVRLGRTIRKHAEGILAYLDTRMTNGPVEGINKLRVNMSPLNASCTCASDVKPTSVLPARTLKSMSGSGSI